MAMDRCSRFGVVPNVTSKRRNDRSLMAVVDVLLGHVNPRMWFGRSARIYCIQNSNETDNNSSVGIEGEAPHIGSIFGTKQ